MKLLNKTILAFSALLIFNCQDDDDTPIIEDPINTNVNFQYKSTINVGGEAASEISAYDVATNKLFITNSESTEISI